MHKARKRTLFTREASGWFKGLAIIMIILSHYAEWWSWFYMEEGISELIRDGISRFGPYGVAVFLLFSGYGLTNSVGEKRIDGRFVLKRVCGVYLPYILVVTIIELLSGGIKTAKDVFEMLYGHDFWYMTVLFTFYIAFMTIWGAFINCHIRAVLISVFSFVYSSYLYGLGEYDFWYISNAAFAVGAVLALYEPVLIKIIDKLGVLFTFLSGAATVCVVYSGLYMEHIWERPSDEIISRVIAVLIFTLFVVFAASVWKMYDPVLGFLGKYSLYLYLSHTFLFMWAINYFNCEMSIRFLVAFLITLVVSVVSGAVFDKVIGLFCRNV